MVAANQATDIAIDPLEDRYRKINPLLLYFLYLRRFWGSLSLLLLVISIAGIGAAFIALLLREGSVDGLSAMGLAPYAAVLALLIAALVFDLIMRNPGKIFGVFGLFYVLGVLLVGLPGLLLGLDGAGKVIEAVSAVSPWLALLLFIPVPFAVFFYFHVIWVLGRASFNLMAASDAERELMRDVPRRSSMLGNLFLRILALPPLFEFARRPRVRFVAILFLSILAAVFLSMLSIFSVASPSTSLRAFHTLSEDCIDLASKFIRRLRCGGIRQMCQPESPERIRAGGGAAGHDRRSAPLGIGSAESRPAHGEVLAGGPATGRYARTAAVSASFRRRPSAAETGKSSALYAAHPDRAAAHKSRPDADRGRHSVGPVVGLGNPRDRRPPYGAARGYFDDKDWQGAVNDLANNSAAVVICLDDTDGIWWEIEHLVTRGHLGKTLFLVHPKFAGPMPTGIPGANFNGARGEGALEPLLQPRRSGSKGKPANVVGFFLDE